MALTPEPGEEPLPEPQAIWHDRAVKVDVVSYPGGEVELRWQTDSLGDTLEFSHEDAAALIFRLAAAISQHEGD